MSKDIKKTRNELQNYVGSSPEIEVDKFTNWASTQVIEPVLTCKPTSVEQVQAVIRGASQLGLQVRAAGRTHSWTPLFADAGNVIMYMRDLERPDGPRIQLIQDEKDPDKQKYLTIVTGVTTGELKDGQIKYGVCLPANVILRVVQMGGVVSPACHGVAWDAKTVSDDIVSMRIVDHEGELRTYSMEEDEDMMRAIQCNLGLWGIIVDFTIKVSPMVIVKTDNKWFKVKDLFYDKAALHKLITENWSVELFWFPFNGISKWEAFEAFMEKEIDCGEWDPKEDEVWARIINKPEKPGPIEEEKIYKQMDIISWIQAQGFKLIDHFVTTFPQSGPLFLRSQVGFIKKQFGNEIYQQLPHAVHFREFIQDVPVYDMEWAFSMDNDCSNLMTAIQDVVDLVHKEALEGRFPMNLPLELRFIADSDAYMAPAICANPKYGGSGHTCYIEVLAVAETPDFHDFCIKVADEWKKLTGARPHWCKEWSFLPGIDDFIKKAYCEQIPKFLSALERSNADPSGMFFNQRLEGLFYPGGHPGRGDKGGGGGGNNQGGSKGGGSGTKGGGGGSKGGGSSGQKDKGNASKGSSNKKPEEKKSSTCKII